MARTERQTSQEVTRAAQENRHKATRKSRRRQRPRLGQAQHPTGMQQPVRALVQRNRTWPPPEPSRVAGPGAAWHPHSLGSEAAHGVWPLVPKGLRSLCSHGTGFQVTR